MELSKLERETIFNYNEAEQMAEVGTFSRSLIAKLEALVTERPNECVRVRALDENGLIAAEYRFPKKWLKVRAGRILTEEQRKELSDRMKNLRSDSKM